MLSINEHTYSIYRKDYDLLSSINSINSHIDNSINSPQQVVTKKSYVVKYSILPNNERQVFWCIYCQIFKNSKIFYTVHSTTIPVK